MATMLKIERLIGKAILDERFRSDLLKDPDAAAKSIGAVLTDAQRVAILNLNAEQIEWWAQGFRELRGNTQSFLW